MLSYSIRDLVVSRALEGYTSTLLVLKKCSFHSDITTLAKPFALTTPCKSDCIAQDID
jgi:hypothetical protein